MGKYDYPCPVCKRNYADCKHGPADIDSLKADNHIREIVRDELKKLAKEEVRRERR